jgi:hypothetical protein
VRTTVDADLISFLNCCPTFKQAAIGIDRFESGSVKALW